MSQRLICHPKMTFAVDEVLGIKNQLIKTRGGTRPVSERGFKTLVMPIFLMAISLCDSPILSVIDILQLWQKRSPHNPPPPTHHPNPNPNSKKKKKFQKSIGFAFSNRNAHFMLKVISPQLLHTERRMDGAEGGGETEKR